MADKVVGGTEDCERVNNLQKNEDIAGRKSPPIYRIPIEEVDDIAKKLLDSKFYLTALELHTELIESGKKELPRLKDFFSNPANFEIQTRLDPLSIISK